MHLLKHYVVFTEYDCFAHGSLKQELLLSQSTLLLRFYLSSFREGLKKKKTNGGTEGTYNQNSLDLYSYYALCYEELKYVLVFI